MTDSPVRQFLCGLRGTPVWFDRLGGNHGDHLLELAARMLMEEAGLRQAETPDAAGFILLNGGGSMVDQWSGLRTLARYSHRWPAIPLAVLPSSFQTSPDRLGRALGERQAPAWLWAREQPSLDILRAAGLPGTVSLGLDHDLAFHLAGHPLLAGRPALGKRILIVERDDWEGPTGRRRPLALPGLARLPERWRSGFRRRFIGPLRRLQDRRSAFNAATLKWLHERHPQTRALPVSCADISLAETCSFEQFLEQVGDASHIVSTRLHVAILGHLLGRTTYLVEGTYHKIRGVYRYSMQNGTTALLSWKDGALRLSP